MTATHESILELEALTSVINSLVKSRPMDPHSWQVISSQLRRASRMAAEIARGNEKSESKDGAA